MALNSHFESCWIPCLCFTGEGEGRCKEDKVVKFLALLNNIRVEARLRKKNHSKDRKEGQQEIEAMLSLIFCKASGLINI